MSHLTAPMPPQAGHHPQKPYLFDLPRLAQPLTPPDTDYETPPHQALPAQNTLGLDAESLPPHMAPSMHDSPFTSPFATLHRKRPSVTYVSSGIRESRERVVHRGLKWLVVVIPPVSMTRGHGHLGHTLSSGPSRRLSSGILLPLYPSLNSQLGAIAREFSFPSISGLCVYLHTTHGGVALTPRVSDDTWPLLWSHLFDARSPSLPPAQLPISGQIEFDIDLTKARWYDSWLASSRREYVDVPQSVAPSRPQSLSHWRADSQGSINDPVDDLTDVFSLAPQTTTRGPGRNIKKLSLLDRFDSAAVRSGSKLVPRDESPPSQTARQSLVHQVLSPIVQEDEPATAKKDIDSRVRSWRLSATAAARSPLAATGQTSLDPANMPNTIEDLPTASASEFELNLDDYTWSVSSAGPPDYDIESTYSWDRVPSVHLDRRGEGSVCLTASICTSFGPDDDYEPFPSAAYTSCLPSPDLAWRMLEDAPPTPTTATSWGAPLSFPPSPAAFSYAPSVDIAARFLSSRPVTPTTATSWGAPLSFPPSPVMSSRAPSPDLGWRASDSVPDSPRFRRAPRTGQPYDMVFPYYDAAHASTWQHVWPYTQDQQGTAATWQHVWPYTHDSHVDASRWQHVWSYTQQQAGVSATWQHVWPYTQRQVGASTWQHVWPYTRECDETREAPGIKLGYPVLDIYPAIYPSFDIYPALLTVNDHNLCAPAVSRGGSYPIFDLYPAAYPSLNIYPATLTVARPESKELSTRLVPSYPDIELYPAVYPYLTIYPAVIKESRNVATTSAVDKDPISAVSVYLAPVYPAVNIYPAVYPHSLDNIYPPVTANSAAKAPVLGVRSQPVYPALDIYPSVYPFNLGKIYPSISAEDPPLAQTLVVSVGVKWQYPVFDIYPFPSSSEVQPATREAVIILSKAYPVLDIYPAAYPWSLYEIYPAIARKEDTFGGGSVVVPLQSHYPVFNIYPATYPWNVYNIYPAVPCNDECESVIGKLQSRYPVFDIYPAVYPHSLDLIYPAVTLAEFTSARTSAAEKTDLPATSKVASGHFRKASWKRGLPPVPPLPKNVHTLTPFSPASRRPLSLGRIGVRISVELPLAYPNICPYPPVYPHFEVYPAAAAGVLSSIDVELQGKEPAVSQYPHLVIYPSVYPFMDIYPGSWGPGQSTMVLRRRSNPKYSHMELRAQVLASVKTCLPATAVLRERRRPKNTHTELRAQVFAEARASTPPSSPTRQTLRAVSPAPAPPPARAPPPVPTTVTTPRASPVRSPVVARSSSTAHVTPRRPPQMDLHVDDELPDSHMQVPTIVAIKPSPTGSDPDAESPVLFEMVTAPSPAPTLVRSRSRSGTVSSRPAPPASAPPRPMGALPLSTVQPPTSELPPITPAQRSINRLSGLPAHPAVNRRVLTSPAAPRPLTTFGPLPAVPSSATVPATSPAARRHASTSPLAEASTQLNGRSPQLPSPPEEWSRGWKTPTEGSLASPLNGLRSAELSRSKTMPTRAAPRGPRSSAMISERMKAFDNPNVIANDDGPLKLSMLAQFPAPPRPPLPSAHSPIQSPSRGVSKLDRSKYPFA